MALVSEPVIRKRKQHYRIKGAIQPSLNGFQLQLQCGVRSKHCNKLPLSNRSYGDVDQAKRADDQRFCSTVQLVQRV